MKAAAVIPAYNESRHIAEVVGAVRPYVDIVIVVDDGSTDDTGALAQVQGATVIRHRSNCGAGAATMTGLSAARRMGFSIAITIDADGQHDPKDIPRMLELLRADKADLVMGDRFAKRNEIPLIRRIFNAIGNLLTFIVTGLYFSDSQCGFKSFGPKALSQVELRMHGFEFCTEIVREAAKYRWRVINIPIKVMYSAYTMAKGQSFSSGVRTAMKILLRSFLR